MLDVLPSSSLSWLRRLRSTWYWASLLVLPYCRMSLRGMAVLTLRRQLNFLSTQPGFPSLGTLEPRDIGTPRCTAMHRDIGTSGHRTPSATEGERAPTQGTAFFRYPLGHRRRFLRCLVHGQAAHRGYDVLGGARWLQVQFLVSLFPRLLRNQGEERGNQAGCSRG